MRMLAGMRGALVGMLLFAAGLVAQGTPVVVGRGPLLCCTVPAADGASDHCLVDLEAPGPARAFLRRRSPADVLRRLDAGWLLLDGHGDPGGLCVLDLGAGSLREVAPGTARELVAVHGADLLHLGEAGDVPPLVCDRFLYATPWRDPGERRRLCDAELARVPIVAGNVAFAVARDERQVWVISLLQGKARHLWTMAGDGSSLRLALAPGGQRLAVGGVDGRGRGRLTVVDPATGLRVAQWDDLPIDVSPLSSSTPTLEVGFASDLLVVCSETRGDRQGLRGSFVWVRRDLATGEVTDETPYAPIGLWHQAPGSAAAAAAAPAAQFVVVADGRTRVLRRAGSTADLARVTTADPAHGLSLSPDGRFAAAWVSGSDGDRTCLFDGEADHDRPRVVADARAHAFVWLPAAR